MTWQTAKAEADRRIAQLPLPPEPARLDGLKITVLDFDSDAVCLLLTGVQPVIFHKTVIRAMRRQLESRGAIVHFKMIPIADTMDWRLTGLSQYSARMR